jgi:uncharacterized protein YbcI
MGRFMQEYVGHGPKAIQTHLIGDMLMIRLQGVLTPAEKHLVALHKDEKGRELLKQVRTQLIESACPILGAMVEEIAGVKVLSMHHDLSTVTGEKIVIFTLVNEPVCRESKRR